MDGTTITPEMVRDAARHAWRMRDVIVPKPKKQGRKFGGDPYARDRKKKRPKLRTKHDVLIPGWSHTREARGKLRLIANGPHQAQVEIEMLLRKEGVSWHRFRRELTMIPPAIQGGKRAQFAFNNVVRRAQKARKKEAA